MITGNGTASGTITSDAQMRKNKKNESYLSFQLSFSVADPKNEGGKTVDVYVILKKGKVEDCPLYKSGTMVSVTGRIDIRNREDKVVFYMNADQIKILESFDGIIPGVSGDLRLIGHVQKKGVEVKTTRNGNKFIVFSAYSAEPINDGSAAIKFKFVWVDFIQFPASGADIETITPSWLAPGALIDAKGDITLDAYNGYLRIKSRISSVCEYKEKAASEEGESSSPSDE